MIVTAPLAHARAPLQVQNTYVTARVVLRATFPALPPATDSVPPQTRIPAGGGPARRRRGEFPARAPRRRGLRRRDHTHRRGRRAPLARPCTWLSRCRNRVALRHPSRLRPGRSPPRRLPAARATRPTRCPAIARREAALRSRPHRRRSHGGV